MPLDDHNTEVVAVMILDTQNHGTPGRG